MPALRSTTSRLWPLALVIALAVLATGCSETGGGATATSGIATVTNGASAPTTSGCPTAAPATAGEAGDLIADAGQAKVQTNKGSFTIRLYPEQAPIATANFVALARCRFYEGITFHRVIAGFVIQAGDPQTKQNRSAFPQLGTGGPGYHFTIESPAPDLGYDPYTVAMANAGGTDTNGSQFFIDLADLNGQLARSYTIFGKVVDGTDVIDAIGQVPTNGTPNDTAQDVPLDPVIIESITIEHASA